MDVFPSMVMAYFMTTYGCLLRIKWKNTSFCRMHSSSKTPWITSIPLLLSTAIPFPATSGLGSLAPMTTRRMPLFMMASVQGGVLP